MHTSDLIYDNIAASYGYNIKKTITQRMKFELLQRYLSFDHRVLDIGCANGIYSIPISGICRHVDAIDINQKMLDIFHQKIQENSIKNITITKKSAVNIKDFNEGSFDLVFSYSTLSLVPDVYKVFKTLNRVLSKDGICILDITGKHNLSQWFWKKWYSKKGHSILNSYSYLEILNILNSFGLKLIESHGMGFCDQWKYLPMLNHIVSKLNFIDNIFHHSTYKDIDYIVSNFPVIKNMANRWLIVAQKK